MNDVCFSPFRDIGAVQGPSLERAGHVNERGKLFHHKSVRAMLDVSIHELVLASDDRVLGQVSRRR
jgi:hypothetical protein